MQKVTIKCPSCGKTQERQVKPIHPDEFTHPEKAGMSSTFWCIYCEKYITANYQFSCDENSIKIKVVGMKVFKGTGPVPAGGLTIRPKRTS